MTTATAEPTVETMEDQQAHESAPVEATEPVLKWELNPDNGDFVAENTANRRAGDKILKFYVATDGSIFSDSSDGAERVAIPIDVTSVEESKSICERRNAYLVAITPHAPAGPELEGRSPADETVMPPCTCNWQDSPRGKEIGAHHSMECSMYEKPESMGQQQATAKADAKPIAAMDDHVFATQVFDLNERIATRKSLMETAKQEYADAKKAWETSVDVLHEFIKRRTESKVQPDLPFNETKAAPAEQGVGTFNDEIGAGLEMREAEKAAAEPTAEPVATEDESWKAVELATLTPPIPAGTLKLLAEHEPSITTLGSLTDWQASRGEWWMKDIKDLGPKKTDAIANATDRYWADHPRSANPLPAQPESKDVNDISTSSPQTVIPLSEDHPPRAELQSKLIPPEASEGDELHAGYVPFRFPNQAGVPYAVNGWTGDADADFVLLSLVGEENGNWKIGKPVMRVKAS